MYDPDDTFLARTGQRWKFMYVLGGGNAVGLLFFWTGFSRADRWEQEPAYVWSLVAGFVIIVLSHLWVSLSLRCPRCRMMLLWTFAGQQGPMSSYLSILRASACPRCGYAARES